MKKIVFTIIFAVSLLSFKVQAQQTFQKFYPVFPAGYGELVFELDDGYLLVGSCFDSKYLVFMIKTDYNGDTLWVRKHDVGLSYFVSYFSSDRDDEGNIYLSISGGDSLNLMKLTPACDIIWTKKISETPWVIKLRQNGNLLIAAGYIYPDMYIYEIDPEGEIIWKKLNIYQDYLTYIVGERVSNLVELNNGQIMVTKTLIDSYGDSHGSVNMILSNEGDSLTTSGIQGSPCNIQIYKNYYIGDEFLATGICNSGSSSRSFLTSYLEDGTIIWQQELTFGDLSAGFGDILINRQNRIVLLGGFYSSPGGHILLQGRTINGDSLWSSVIGYADDNYSWNFIECKDGGYLLAATLEEGGYTFPWLIKTDSVGRISALGKQDIKAANPLKVYPNPATEQVVFECQEEVNGTILISNLTGQTCAELKISGQKTIYNASSLKPGLYFYTCKTESSSFIGKILIKH